MAKPVQPGSYTTLFSQRLMQTIMKMAMSNPANAANAGSASPMSAQLDAMLMSDMQSMDSMLAAVGLTATTGLGPSVGTPATGGLTGGLTGTVPQPQTNQQALLNGGLSLTG